MNTLTPRQTALFIAVFTALAVAAAVSVIFLVIPGNLLLNTVVATLVVFILVYIFTTGYLSRLIMDKINPIYKIIHNINVSKSDLTEDIDGLDALRAVKKDVILWAKKKALEITQLKQLEKYRREFLGNVSHELKTPIFNIQGYILTLLDGGLEDPSINKLFLERTEKSINRLISIVNDLESISKLESGELKLDLQKHNILQIFEESFEMHEMMAAERGIKLKFERKYDKPLYVLADRQKILEAINNLIINSIKYGKSGGTTKVNFIEMGENLFIEVTDNGLGIAEKDIPRIFERFYRTDKSRSREMGGTGLGLAIVKHIIEAHNQTINVRSHSGEGSTFAFTLKRV